MGRKTLVFLLFLGFGVLYSAQPAHGNPPEKWLILKKVKGSLWVNKSASWALNTYTTRLLKKHKLGKLPTNKKRLLDNSSTGTVGVVLYEFTTGSGAKTRYLYNDGPFATALRNAPGFTYVLKTYLNQYPNEMTHLDTAYNLHNLRYQFSPVIKPISFKSFETGFIEHVRAVNATSLEQFLLGSFYADVVAVNDDEILVHIWNHTSKSSLMLHLAHNVQRPQPFGTVTQHVYLRVRRSELAAFY